MNNDNKDIKREIEELYRVQLEEEIRRRKEFEEKYYEREELLQSYKAGLEAAQKKQAQLAQYNRDLLACRIPVFTYFKTKRAYRRNEQSLLAKGVDYWKPVFNPEYYAKENEDVVSAVGAETDALLNHFVLFGCFEGRQASEEFDVERYMAFNPDVAEMCVTDKRAAYLHYIEYGIKEKRKK